LEKLNIKDIELKELDMEEELAINGGAACTPLVHCMSASAALKKHKTTGICPYF